MTRHTFGRVSLSHVRMALLVIGQGAFFSFYCAGPAALAFASARLGTWHDIALAQLAMLLGAGLGCLGARVLGVRRSTMSPRATSCASATAMLASLGCMHAALGSGGTLASALPLMFVTGMSLAPQLLQWFGALLSLSRAHGRGRAIRALAAGQLLALVTGVLARHAGDALASIALAAGCIVLSTICLCAFAPEAGDQPAHDVTARTGYRLSSYATSVVTSFGVMWGLCVVLLMLLSYRPDAGGLDVGMLLAGMLASLLLAASSWRGSLSFGLLIRLSVAAAGMVFALVPLLQDATPFLIGPLLKASCAILGAAMGLFSVEICREQGRHISDVFPVNYALFVVAACLAAGAFLLACLLAGEALAWDVACALAVVAALSVIPMLPSRASDASTFTLRALPENEGYEARTDRTREELVMRYGLSARKSDVLALLLRGRTRQQIADELGLSSWTVKEHVGKIYAKVGVHSAKELMARVAKGA